jgi:hypothetical protein
MKKRLIQLSKIAAVLVFAVGLILFIQAGIATQAKASKSFVVTYKVSNIEADNKPVIEEIRVQSVKATGEYKMTIYYLPSGKTAEYIATQDSVYEVKTDSLQYFGKALSSELNNNFRSAAFLKTHPNFSREEKICDLTTYVLHTQDGDAWIEGYSAVETGNTQLKTVLYHGNGSYTVIEAISVQFRDVSDDEVRLPDLPVKFNKADQRVDEYRNGGAVGAGNNLKNQIDKKKQQSINQ